MTVLVQHVASRWVEVDVYAADEHFLWCRRPGPEGPPQFRVVNPHGTVDADTDVALVTPSVDGTSLTYRVGGPSSAAAWLAQPDTRFVDTALEAIQRATAAVCTATTGPGGRGTPAAPPAPLQRLGAHLADRAPSPSVRRWRAALEEALGTDAVDALTATAGAHLSGATSPAHGGLSIGGIIPSTTALPTAVLSGEDWGRAAPGHDLGWLVGELMELACSAATDAALRDTLATTVRTLLTGSEHTTGVTAAARLRVALHAEDFSHFVGWDDALLDRASLLGSLYIDDTWLQTGHVA